MSMGSRLSAGWRWIKEKFSGKKTVEPAAPEPLTFTPDYVPPTAETSRTTEEYVAWVEGQSCARGSVPAPEPEEIPEQPVGEEIPAEEAASAEAASEAEDDPEA